MKEFLLRIWEYLTHLLGKITKKYYWEDYIRVYPQGICINRRGMKREPLQNDINNFLNHQKFYKFAAQFAGNALWRTLAAAAVTAAHFSKTRVPGPSMVPMHQSMRYVLPENITKVPPNLATKTSRI